MVSLPGPAKATYILCIVEFDDLADNFLCSQMYADNHGIDSKDRKNFKTNNFENFVFLRIFCIFLYLFVFFCIFLYCYFFVLSEKIGRHEYKKIQKKHAFSPYNKVVSSSPEPRVTRSQYSLHLENANIFI